MSEKKEFDLYDALGWGLSGIERPIHISEVEGVIEGFSEYKLVEKLTLKTIRDCVINNPNTFDYYNDVISFSNEKYNYDELINELNEIIFKSSSTDSKEIIKACLLITRFNVLQQEKQNLDSINKRFMHRISLDLDRLDIGVLNEAISSLLNEYSINDDFSFRSTNENHKLLQNCGELIRRYDWRDKKINNEVFEKLIDKIAYKYFLNKSHRPNENLSEFIKCLPNSKASKGDVVLRTNRIEFVSHLDYSKRKNSKLTLILDPDNSLISVLKALLKGYESVKIYSDIRGYLDKENYNLSIIFPPLGRITKKEWKEIFPGENLNLSSLEEMTVKLAMGSMSEDGLMHLIVPDSFLFSGHNSLSAFRKKIIEKKWVESAIKLPRSYKLEGASVNLNLLTINKSESNKIYFCDLSKYESKNEKVTTKLINDFINEKKIESEVSRYVTTEEVSDKDYDLSVGRYINPVFYKEIYSRYNDEEVLYLKDLVLSFQTKREEVSSRYPFVNMTELADEPINFILDTDHLPKKDEYSSKQPVIKTDSLLIGTIGGVLKPTLFHYQDTPIFIGPNVVCFKVKSEKIDPEYLIQELNSDFVIKQIQAKYRGNTISYISKSDILNIAIRVPDKDKQINLVKKWITSVAKQKIKSLNIKKEQLFQEEYDLIHDLHHTLKNELSILKGAFRDLTKYIYLKDSSGSKVDIKEPIRLAREGTDPQLIDSVEQKIETTNKSLAHISEFVSNYKTILRFDERKQNRTEIILKDYLTNLCSEYSTFDFEVNEEIDSSTNHNETSKIKHFEIFEDVGLLRLVVTNILDNAIKYGFSNSRRRNLIDITIRDVEDSAEKQVLKSKEFGDFTYYQQWIEISIKNNGKRISEQFDKTSYFKKGYSTDLNISTGLGGYHIKKAMESMNGKVEINILEESEYSFEVKLKFDLLRDGKSPNINYTTL